MEVMKAIEDGLSLGCGISLSQAMNSSRFRELLARQNTLLSRYPKNTHRGIALRAGHLAMGQLLHTLPESKALAEAKKIEAPKFGCGIEMRALIQFFGESLIAEAGKCLPDEVLELAREWKTASVERQIAIARELFFVFRSENQSHKKGEVLTLAKAERNLLQRAAERWNRDESDGEDILPRLYGRWNEKCSANCQGKAQMLVAFAQLVGAEVMAVNTLSDGNQELRHLRNELAMAITRDARERKLSDASSDFNDSMAGHIFAETFGEQIRDFHVGVALKLRDGRWILIDPHALAWGVFSQHYDLDSTHQLLQKYSEVLPGLALIRSDGGETADRIKARISLSYDLIERSRKLEAVIRERVRTTSDFIGVVMASEDFEFLMRLNSEQDGEVYTPFPDDPEVRFALVAAVLMGGMDKLFEPWTMMDPEYRQRQINIWLTFYHCLAMNHMGNQMSDNGELVHPVCEFNANPEYHLALSAINGLMVRRDEGSGSFFVDYGFDQLTLYNAMFRRTELGFAAAKVARSLPFAHDNMHLRFGI